MPSKLSNKDYGGPGTESCYIQGVQEMARECVSLMVTYTEHPSGYRILILSTTIFRGLYCVRCPHECSFKVLVL